MSSIRETKHFVFFSSILKKALFSHNLKYPKCYVLLLVKEAPQNTQHNLIISSYFTCDNQNLNSDPSDTKPELNLHSLCINNNLFSSDFKVSNVLLIMKEEISKSQTK